MATTPDAWQLTACWNIAKRYARLLPSGKPVRCQPSRAELTGDVDRKARHGTDGKIVYDTYDRAVWAAREMFSVIGNRQKPYRCRRSRRGHFHLETDTDNHKLT